MGSVGFKISLSKMGGKTLNYFNIYIHTHTILLLLLLKGLLLFEILDFDI